MLCWYPSRCWLKPLSPLLPTRAVRARLSPKFALRAVSAVRARPHSSSPLTPVRAVSPHVSLSLWLSPFPIHSGVSRIMVEYGRTSWKAASSFVVTRQRRVTDASASPCPLALLWISFSPSSSTLTDGSPRTRQLL